MWVEIFIKIALPNEQVLPEDVYFISHYPNENGARNKSYGV